MPGGGLFQGVTAAGAREFVAQAIAAYNPDRFLYPCCGRFSVAQVLCSSGFPRNRIFASDFSVYSAVIGYLSDPSKSFDDLDIRLEVGEEFSDCPCRADLDKPSPEDVMVFLRYHQSHKTSRYAINERKDIRVRWAQYREAVAVDLREVVASLRGIHYDIKDVREVTLEVEEDPKAALYVSAPHYTGGYQKMFCAPLTFKRPRIDEFDFKNEWPAMAKRLFAAKGLVLAWHHAPMEALGENPDPWHIAWSLPDSMVRNANVLANRMLDNTFADQQVQNPAIKKYPIYDDQEITEESVISFEQVDKETCLYYRDLFVHKLGTTKSETYFLMLIDGRAATALGVNTKFIRNMQSFYVYETFGITKTSKRYKRLGKLFMLCLTSDEFRLRMHHCQNWGITEPFGVQTTSVTTHPEGKTDRSVLKVHSREQLPDGRWKIIYRCMFRHDTWSDCVKLWLSRWGGTSRDVGAVSEVEGVASGA